MKHSRMLLAVTTLFIVSLSGCATIDNNKKSETVFIPVVASKPALPARPHLAIADLTAKSTADEIVKAYAISVSACIGYSTELEEMLK